MKMKIFWVTFPKSVFPLDLFFSSAIESCPKADFFNQNQHILLSNLIRTKEVLWSLLSSFLQPLTSILRPFVPLGCVCNKIFLE